MTPEAQRKALAELEGWTDCFIIGFEAIGFPPDSAKQEEMDEKITPSYDTLDDCQRVFKWMTEKQKDHCMEIVTMSLNPDEIYVPWAFEATPEQWRESILRAAGKWIETTEEKK